MGNIIVNNKEIKRVFSGNKEIFNIYKGDTQIWQNFKMVDLGLPSGTLWADRNLGAINTNDLGGEYAWGITDNYGECNWDGSGENTDIKYICSSEQCGTVNDPLFSSDVIYKDRDNEWFGDISGREMDVTHKNANTDWRLPTAEEFNELLLYCAAPYGTPATVKNSNNVVIGIKLTGPNGNSITLPISSNNSDVLNDVENLTTYNVGYYWTGTINSGNAKQAYSITVTANTNYIYETVTSRFRHLFIRPVYAAKPAEATISFKDPETDNALTSLSLYPGESRSLYFEISPELSTDKKVYFTSSSSKITVTNTGYITVKDTATATSANQPVVITATLNNGNIATCNVNILEKQSVSNIVFKDVNGNEIIEDYRNHISISLDQWSSMWFIPTLLNANGTSDGIINRTLHWETTDGEGNAFMVPLYDMIIYSENSIPSNYKAHPVKIFAASSNGTTTIEVTKENVTKTITITINDNSNKCNGYSFVDLGIPSSICWATQNVGATNFDKDGDYFAWGEVNSKSNYKLSTYEPVQGTTNQVVFLGNEIHGTEYDAAKVNWGGHWRMPSYQEFKLLDSLNMAQVKINNKTYVLKMGLNNDNYILLPQNSFMDGTALPSWAANTCYYWTSTCKVTEQPTDGKSDIVYEYHTANRYSSKITCARSVYNGLGIRAVYSFDAPFIKRTGTNTYVISHEDNTLSIYFTTDGTDPKTSNTRTQYSTAITTENNIRAVAIDRDGNISNEAASLYIDLGLPSGIKWCTFNLGADSCAEPGSFYRPTKQTSITQSDLNQNDNTKLISQILTINFSGSSFYGNSNYDAALTLGENYRTPRFNDFEELVQSCSFIYTQVYDGTNYVNIYKVIGPNGNYIYLPFGTIKNTSQSGESSTTINLLISDNVVKTNNGTTLSSVVNAKFIKSYRDYTIDSSSIHNLNAVSPISAPISAFHIRPTYIGDVNNNYNLNSPRINNINNVDNTNNDNNSNEHITGAVYKADALGTNTWAKYYPNGLCYPKYCHNNGVYYCVGGCMAFQMTQMFWNYKWPVIRKYYDATINKVYTINGISDSSNGPIPDATGKKFPVTYTNRNAYTYTIEKNSKEVYQYHKLLDHYTTSLLSTQSTSSNNFVLVTDTKLIDYEYSSSYAKGKQYTYEQALEQSKFLNSWATLVPLRFGPVDTVGSDTQTMKKQLLKSYQYNRKAFSWYRNNLSRAVLEEILQESSMNKIPIQCNSNHHAWMIYGYDTSNHKVYVNLNLGDVNKAYSHIDKIQTSSAAYDTYSKVSTDTSSNELPRFEFGFTPNCIKAIKDYFMIYASRLNTKRYTAANTTSTVTIESYFIRINLDSGYNVKEDTITISKPNTLKLYTTKIYPRGNAIPERIYVAVCLENSQNEIVKILKSVCHTPKGENRLNGTQYEIPEISINDINLWDVESGTYTLTIRYSKDDGLTYSERVMLPDIYERETVTLTMNAEKTEITISLSYKAYGVD